MARSPRLQASLITSARIPTSLDADQRNRRYLATMAVRVACFVVGMFAPLPWNVALFLFAAFLPAMAVLLANAVDDRTPPADPDESPGSRRELTAGEIVRGEVEEDR